MFYHHFLALHILRFPRLHQVFLSVLKSSTRKNRFGLLAVTGSRFNSRCQQKKQIPLERPGDLFKDMSVYVLSPSLISKVIHCK